MVFPEHEMPYFSRNTGLHALLSVCTTRHDQSAADIPGSTRPNTDLELSTMWTLYFFIFLIVFLTFINKVPNRYHLQVKSRPLNDIDMGKYQPPVGYLVVLIKRLTEQTHTMSSAWTIIT